MRANIQLNVEDWPNVTHCQRMDFPTVSFRYLFRCWVTEQCSVLSFAWCNFSQFEHGSNSRIHYLLAGVQMWISRWITLANRNWNAMPNCVQLTNKHFTSVAVHLMPPCRTHDKAKLKKYNNTHVYEIIFWSEDMTRAHFEATTRQSPLPSFSILFNKRSSEWENAPCSDL